LGIGQTGHWALGIGQTGHWALAKQGIGHWALGIGQTGHWALDSPPYLTTLENRYIAFLR